MGLIRYRVRVEIEYFIALCQIPLPQLSGVTESSFPALRAIYENFTEKDALRIKEIEKTTNHDPSIDGTTSYIAVIRKMALRSYAPFEYDYYLTTGNTTEIRENFSTVAK
jgi:hypothetical protein